MSSKEENVWIIEAKLLTEDSQRMEEAVQELEGKGFSVRKRSIVFDN